MNKPASTHSLFPPDTSTDPADYENDFLLWIEKQAALLRAEKFGELDLENLIEEIDSMGRSLRRELHSRLTVLLMHLLKCQFQPEKKSSSWQGSIMEQRSDIELLLIDNPSLRREVEKSATTRYPNAVKRAVIETGLPRSTFPALMPYSAEQLLDEEFTP